jgi:hypothetical protein
MKTKLFAIILAFAGLASCSKKIENIVSSVTNKGSAIATGEFVKYTIAKGEQYCDRNIYTPTNYQQLSFSVRFDSTAIYQTVASSNQTDINKLFGFSDNNAQHHLFSARFGWRWSNNAIRLFAYIYNNGVISFKELGTVAIGSENSCSIKVNKDSYLFTLNQKETAMPRASTTSTAEGYKLYPYFGGDEVAPHTISVFIQEL